MNAPSNFSTTKNRQAVCLVLPDALQRDLVASALRRGGFIPQFFSSLEEIRAQLEKQPPAVMIVDMYLPASNGLEFVTALKQDGLLDQTAVIMISALGFPEVVQQTAKAGVRDFLVKPIDADLLVTRVRRVLGLTS